MYHDVWVISLVSEEWGYSGGSTRGIVVCELHEREKAVSSCLVDNYSKSGCIVPMSDLCVRFVRLLQDGNQR